jgi:hypothetical protein
MDALVLALLMFFGQTPTQSTTSSTTDQTTTTSPGTLGQNHREHDARTQEESTGVIRGIVTIGGKRAKGAVITIFDVATNYTRSVKTNGDGYYAFNNVAATLWTVEAAIEGNRQQRTITVTQMESSTLNFALDDPK